MSAIRYLDRPVDYEAAIRRLLTAADEEFVPPLTHPSRTEMSRASGTAGPSDIDRYVEACLDRPMVGIFDDDRLVGFGSLETLTDSEPLAEYVPSTHLTVLVIEASYRSQGLATALYEYLFNSLPAERCQPTISTKTWSTNSAHLAILDSFGFECVYRVENDRAPGVDTVYYARKR